MAQDSDQLDRLIQQLEESLKSNKSSFWGSFYDEKEWNRMHSLIKEISAGFKSVRYPTKEQREKSWNHYADIRNQVFEEQKNLKAANSSKIADKFLREIEPLYWSTSVEAIVSIVSFGSADTTPDMMKRKGRELKEITERLKSYNRQMNKSDNDRVYGKIREVRESHNRFWQILKEERDKIQQERERESSKHRDHLISELDLIEYNQWADNTWSTLTAGMGKVDKEDMKWRASRLKELSQEFSRAKNEMFGRHKAEVFNKIKKVRESHDVFWGRYREYAQARQSQFREKVEANLEKNRVKLSKAQDALYRFKNKRDDLQSKIYDSYSENWKDKAYGWLSEFEDKIHDIEQSIERFENWIQEDEDKLSRR